MKTLCSTFLALAVLAMPGLAHASDKDAFACSVTIEHVQNGVTRLAYVKDFVVSAAAPFSDDFSTSTRFRFFDATLSFDGGVPVVGIRLDADVDVFDTAALRTSLKVRDQNGESTSGTHELANSTVALITSYTLSCAKSKN